MAINSPAICRAKTLMVLSIGFVCSVATLGGCSVVRDSSGINASVSARARTETQVTRLGDYGKKDSAEYATAKAAYTNAADTVNPWLEGVANDVETRLVLDVPETEFTTKFGPLVEDFVTKAKKVPGMPAGASDSTTDIIKWIVEGFYQATKDEAKRVAALVRSAKWKSFDDVIKGGVSPIKPPTK